jgi:hypothetical protein
VRSCSHESINQSNLNQLCVPRRCVGRKKKGRNRMAKSQIIPCKMNKAPLKGVSDSHPLNFEQKRKAKPLYASNVIHKPRIRI